MRKKGGGEEGKRGLEEGRRSGKEKGRRQKVVEGEGEKIIVTEEGEKIIVEDWRRRRMVHDGRWSSQVEERGKTESSERRESGFSPKRGSTAAKGSVNSDANLLHLFPIEIIEPFGPALFLGSGENHIGDLGPRDVGSDARPFLRFRDGMNGVDQPLLLIFLPLAGLAVVLQQPA